MEMEGKDVKIVFRLGDGFKIKGLEVELQELWKCQPLEEDWYYKVEIGQSQSQ